MDVEQQILKHLPRDAQSTVSVIDDYCTIYKDLFKEVRNYECLKYLRDWNHLTHQEEIITTKALAAYNSQGTRNQLSSIITSFHSFLKPCIANSPRSGEQLKKRRLKKTLKALKGKKIIVVIDETGDRKKRCDPAPT